MQLLTGLAVQSWICANLSAMIQLMVTNISMCPVQELIRTARAQRSCKWYEEAVAGKLVLRGNLERQLKRASSKHEKLWTVLQGIAEAHPKLMQPLQRALMHHMNAQASDWPQTNKVQLEASVSQLEDSENQAALAHVTGD